MWQISYPPVNGASQANYFLPQSQKLAVFQAKTGFQNKLWQPKLQAFLPKEKTTNLLYLRKCDLLQHLHH